MRPYAKFLTGLAVALAAGWVSHAPLGRGEAFIGRLEQGAVAAVRGAEVPGVNVRMDRDPLRRRAILWGPADEFQREGQGSLPGLNDLVLAVPGVASIEWDMTFCCPAPPEGS